MVQGVGFRPFVYSLAVRHGLRGWVLDTSAGVEVLAGLVPVNDGGVSLGQAAVAGYTVLEHRGELQ